MDSPISLAYNYLDFELRYDAKMLIAQTTINLSGFSRTVFY